MNKKISKLIDELGNSFRGLWRSKEIYPDGKIKQWGWTVTITYENEIVETPYTETPEEALKYALFVIGKKNED